MNCPKSISEVLLVLQTHSLDLALQRCSEVYWQHGHPILGAFAIANDNSGITKIDILNAQSNALHQPQAASVEQLSHEPRCAPKMPQNPMNFVAGKNHRHAC